MHSIMYDKNKETNSRKEAVHMAKEIEYKKSHKRRRKEEMRQVREMADSRQISGRQA